VAARLPAQFEESREGPIVEIGEKDNGTAVSIRVGDTVRITLPENATTGYRRAIARYDEQFAQALASEPQYQSQAVGSGGSVSFLFRATKAGTAAIALKHWRHWEGEGSITGKFDLRLEVQP
jgi:inhibitor of cysteine peptidase